MTYCCHTHNIFSTQLCRYNEIFSCIPYIYYNGKRLVFMTHVVITRKICRYSEKICCFNEKRSRYYEKRCRYSEKICCFNEKRSRYYEKRCRFNEKIFCYNDIIEWKKILCVWQQCVTVAIPDCRQWHTMYTAFELSLS